MRTHRSWSSSSSSSSSGSGSRYDTVGPVAHGGVTVERRHKSDRKKVTIVWLGDAAFRLRRDSAPNLSGLLMAFHSGLQDLRATGDKELLDNWVKQERFDHFKDPAGVQASFKSGRFESIRQFEDVTRADITSFTAQDLGVCFSNMQTACLSLFGKDHGFHAFLATAQAEFMASLAFDTEALVQTGMPPLLAQGAVVHAAVLRFDGALRQYQSMAMDILMLAWRGRSAMLSRDGSRIRAAVPPLHAVIPSFASVHAKFHRPVVPAVIGYGPYGHPAAMGGWSPGLAPPVPRARSAKAPSKSPSPGSEACWAAGAALPAWWAPLMARAAAGAKWDVLAAEHPRLKQACTRSPEGVISQVCAKFILFGNNRANGCRPPAGQVCGRVHLGPDGKPVGATAASA